MNATMFISIIACISGSLIFYLSFPILYLQIIRHLKSHEFLMKLTDMPKNKQDKVIAENLLQMLL